MLYAMNVRCFLYFIFLLLVIKVSGQSDPLSVSSNKGESVILKCAKMEAEVNAEDVFWKFKEDKFVIFSKNKPEDNDVQDPDFKDRVVFLDLEAGNFSIQLSDVRKTDEGLYTCYATVDTQLQAVNLAVIDKPGNGQNKLQADGMLKFLLGCALLCSFIF